MIVFNASMPRAGSSLLQHIMGQNPNFYVTPTSPLFDLVDHSQQGFYKKPIMLHPSTYDSIENSLYSYCREGIKGYILNLTNKNHFLDKNRGWLSKYLFLQKLYSNPKVICLIRDLRSVFSSFEKQYRKRPPKHYEIEKKYRTVYERYQYFSSTPLIEFYINDLINIVETKNDKNIIFRKFEDMCSNPQETFNKIYNYLDLPIYNHDFNNIKQLYDEVDANLLFIEHNNISPKLQSPLIDYNSVLGDRVSNEIYEKYNGFFNFFNYTK